MYAISSGPHPRQLMPASAACTTCAGEPFSAFSVHLRKRKGRVETVGCPAGVFRRRVPFYPVGRWGQFPRIVGTLRKGKTASTAYKCLSSSGASPQPRKVGTIPAFCPHLPVKNDGRCVLRVDARKASSLPAEVVRLTCESGRNVFQLCGFQ